MWAGDVRGDYPTQWALNPSAYQNVPNEQVDWATLAQQWIMMKETLPVDQVPAAPPPPPIKAADLEAGEAPMDMSKDDPPAPAPAPVDGGSGNWNNWSNWQQWNNWGWTGSADAPVTADKTAAAEMPPYNYTSSSSTTTPTYSSHIPPATTFDYNHGSSGPDNYNQPNYWSAGGPGPYVRNRSSDWRPERSTSQRTRQAAKPEDFEPEASPVLDAAKRKQLPAWIREGLEKMEREKQRKMERERQMKERELELQKQKQAEEEALASGIPVKSKFETDSEDSEKEQEEISAKPRRSRFDTSAPSPLPTKLASKSFSPPPIQHKTKEEIMQDVMQQMRYVLTDILMKVTNDEMRRVAEEVMTEMRAKAPATQLRKTPALTSLTGKLGLGIYDSDSNEDSDDASEKESSKPMNGVDSDEELKERISRKKQEFSRYERDIERMVELQEERDREREQVAQHSESESESEAPPTASQVDTNPASTGVKTGMKAEDERVIEVKTEPLHMRYTPDKSHKSEPAYSVDQSEDSDNNSSSKSDSTSRSSDSSRRKKSKKPKKKKDKKSSKRKRKRSSSQSSERDRKRSHRKSSKRERKSRSRSRSRSRDYYSRSRRRSHRSYSRDYSPDYYRGKRSSHRSRD